MAYVLINGHPGVGKVTIAHHLARCLSGPVKVLNNHLLIDTAAALYERIDTGYQPLRKALRETIFASLESYPPPATVLFTESQSTDSEGTSTARSYLSAALSRSRTTPTHFFSVIITCSEEENIRRLTSGTRGAGNTKLTDVDVLRSIRAYAGPYRFGVQEGVNLEIEVDVTEKSAEEVATVIFEAMRASLSSI